MQREGVGNKRHSSSQGRLVNSLSLVSREQAWCWSSATLKSRGQGKTKVGFLCKMENSHQRAKFSPSGGLSFGNWIRIMQNLSNLLPEDKAMEFPQHTIIE